MKKGQRAGNNPIGVDVVEGKSYFWCTCGNSKKQPLYRYELTTKDHIAKGYTAIFGGLLIYLMYKGMIKSGQLS